LYHFLKEQFGDAPEILPKVSKKDVAAAIGTAPETLSRVLLRLKSAGKLHWIRDKISISPNWRI
jgi:CRP-like cAMP-binding protein